MSQPLQHPGPLLRSDVRQPRAAQAPPSAPTGPAPGRTGRLRGAPSFPRLHATSTAPRLVDALSSPGCPRRARHLPSVPSVLSPPPPRSAWRVRWGLNGGSWPSTPAVLSACGASRAVSWRGWGDGVILLPSDLSQATARPWEPSGAALSPSSTRCSWHPSPGGPAASVPPLPPFPGQTGRWAGVWRLSSIPLQPLEVVV